MRVYQVVGADGKEYGPVGADQVRQWIAQGRANAQTRVRAQGETEWRPLASFPELAAALAPGAGGAPSAPYAPPGAPLVAIPNYLTQAILVTIFCCMPFGIPAIVYAAQVNGKVQAGDLAGAQESSRRAKLWCWWAFGGYFGVLLIYGIFVAVVAMREGGFR